VVVNVILRQLQCEPQSKITFKIKKYVLFSSTIFRLLHQVSVYSLVMGPPQSAAVRLVGDGDGSDEVGSGNVGEAFKRMIRAITKLFK
jgi:hypothetical protein